MRVLALVPGDISEQLLFFSTLESLQQAYPNAAFSVVVEPRAKSAYTVSKLVNDVIVFDYQAANSPADWANLLGVLRDREFEVALSASPRWEEGVLLWLSGIPTRVADSQTSTPWLYTQVAPTSDSPNPSERYRALLTGLKIDQAQAETAELNLPEADLAWAEAQRTQLGLKNGYVMLYPETVATSPFPIDSWLTVVQDFQAKQPQMALALLKDPASQSAVANLARRQPSLKVLEPTNIGQTAALLAGADLVLTPDSYVMQLAISLKVFTLALLRAGATAALPAANGGETRCLSIQSPTGNLADLSPDTVLQQVWGG
ncbi:MAG: glycosyltransferase family 9 protein [Cyanobacteria bacterium P01_A01_bin.105]